MKIFKHGKKAPTIAKAMVTGEDALFIDDSAVNGNAKQQAAVEPKSEAKKQDAATKDAQPAKPMPKPSMTVIPKAKVQVVPAAASLKQAQAELKTANENAASTAQEIDVLEAQMQDLAQQYNLLRDNLKLKMFQQKDLFFNNLQDAQNNVSKQRENLAEIERQIADLQSENDQALTTQMARVNQDIPKIKEDMLGLQNQIQAANQKASELQKQISELDGKLTKSKAEEQVLSDNIKGENDLVKMLMLAEQNKQRALELVDEQKLLTNTMKATEAQLSDVENNTTTQQTALNEHQAQLDKHQNTVKQITSQIDRAKRQRAQQEAVLANKRNTLKQRIESIALKISGYQSNLNTLDAQIKNTFGTSYFVQDVQFPATANYTVLLNQSDAQCQQMRLFEFLNQRIAQPLTVISLTYNLDLKQNLMQWAKQNKTDVPQMVNLFTELQASGDNTAPAISIHENENLQGTWDDDKINRAFKDHDGHLLMVATYENAERIKAIRYYDHDSLTRIATLNEQGQLSRNRLYTEAGRQADEFYRVDGTLALKFVYQDGKNVKAVHVYDNNSLKVQAYDSLAEFNYAWLMSYLQLHSDTILVGMDNDKLYRRVVSETTLKTLPYLVDVPQNLGKLKAILHSKKPWQEMLVPSRHERMLLESVTNQDISVTCIDNRPLGSLPRQLDAAVIKEPNQEPAENVGQA